MWDEAREELIARSATAKKKQEYCEEQAQETAELAQGYARDAAQWASLAAQFDEILALIGEVKHGE